MEKQKRVPDGMSRTAFVACDTLKRVWRHAHPNIVAYWHELEEIVKAAISAPGVTLNARRVRVRRDGAWLRLQLPSGRSLCYPSPQIEDEKITFLGVDQFTRRWQRQTTFAGRLFENLCQAVARDVMFYNMPGIEAQSYEILLSVHDEVICETPDTDHFVVDELSSLLAAAPAWALGMPLAAAGFECKSYRKD
jgi:DNA polymerase